MSIDRAKALKAAQKFLAKGQLDRAITEYQKVVASDPSDARSLLKLGDLYTRQGATADASATYRQVAEQYAEQGFFLKAVAVYKQILKLDSGDLAATEKLAEMYEMLSLTSDALSTYEQVVDAHTRAGAPDKAVNALGRLAELDPENIAARIRHAEALSKVDRIDEAADAFRLGADALKDQGRIDDYIKVTERLLFHSHEDVDRARDLASIYIERGNAKPALAHLQTCFKADPRDVNTLELLSHAFSLLGQTTKASSVLKEMVRIHADAGDTDAESAALRKLLEVDPSDPEARQRLDVLGASSSSEASIEIVEDDDLDDLIIIDDDADGDAPAITDEDEPTETAAAGSGSEDADAQITRLMSECEVFIRYGLQDKVLLTLGKVVELDPGHVEARERLKQVHLEAGDTDEAVAQLVALAEHLGEGGDASGARRYLEEAQQLAPGNDSVAARLAELDGGEDAMIVDDEDDVIIVEDAEESFAGMFESEAPEPAAAMPATISQAAAATVAATSEAPAFEEDGEDDEPELVIEDSDEDLEELGVTEADLIEPPVPMPSPPAVSVPPPLPAAARAAAAVTFVDSEPAPEPAPDAGSISLPGPAVPAPPA
ncbi:MAG: tetratricopeptide repeat protein, partial [Myxococcales bacterium]|nr:tetratricopeptide repeat protein [Myxococcales bacterium]